MPRSGFDDGMIGSVSVYGKPVVGCRYGGWLLRLVAEADGDGRLGTQAHHDGAIGRGHEVVGRYALAATQIGIVSSSISQVEPSGIALDARFVAIVEYQFAQRLVLFGTVALHLQHTFLGRLVVLAEEGFANAREGLVRIGIEDLPSRFARPEGYVVQFQPVLLRAAIDDGTQSAVSDYEGFLEEVCRPVVMEGERILLCPETAGIE